MGKQGVFNNYYEGVLEFACVLDNFEEVSRRQPLLWVRRQGTEAVAADCQPGGEAIRLFLCAAWVLL